MQIELEEQFFDLGGLSENTFGSVTVLGQRNLNGSDDEKKYDYINELCKQITDLISWASIEDVLGYEMYNNDNAVVIKLEWIISNIIP